MNKFKIGDKVICIDNTNYREKLKVGKTYIVKSYEPYYPSRVHDLIELKGINCGGVWVKRFEKVENPQSEIKQMNNKITYHVRCDGAKNLESYHEDIVTATNQYEKLVNVYGSGHFYSLVMVKDGVETLIAQSEGPVKIPVVNGHEMKYKKGNQYVEFGCAKISLQMLWPIKDVMFDSFAGCNRSVKSITLCSGVLITKTEMKEIFDYVEKVNGAPYSLPKC